MFVVPNLYGFLCSIFIHTVKVSGIQNNTEPQRLILWTKTESFKAYSNQMICLCLIVMWMCQVFFFLQLMFPDPSTSEASDDPVALMKTCWSQMRHTQWDISAVGFCLSQNKMLYLEHQKSHDLFTTFCGPSDSLALVDRQTRAHTHVGFCGLRGLSIGVMVFILYKLCVLLPYTYPTPKLSPHRRLCASLDFQKNTI